MSEIHWIPFGVGCHARWLRSLIWGSDLPSSAGPCANSLARWWLDADVHGGACRAAAGTKGDQPSSIGGLLGGSAPRYELAGGPGGHVASPVCGWPSGFCPRQPRDPGLPVSAPPHNLASRGAARGLPASPPVQESLPMGATGPGQMCCPPRAWTSEHPTAAAPSFSGPLATLP